MRSSLLLKALTVVVLLTTAVSADSLSIRQFGGYDRSINDLNLQPGQATAAINWDLSKGTLDKRDGYAFRSFADTTADYTGLFGFIDRAGKKRLFATYQTEHEWDYVGHTEINGDSISNNAYFYQFNGATPSWENYNNKLIHANGYNAVLRWSGGNVNPLVENPPGSFRAAPMKADNSDWLLDGDYYYSIKGFAHTKGWPSHYSEPIMKIHVDSGNVVLFAGPRAGMFRDDADTIAPGIDDSTFITITRTKAGRDAYDSLFVIVICTLVNADTGQFWIDSIPDDSFSLAGTYLFADFADTGYLNYTADTTTHTEYRLGQPQWISTDTVPSDDGVRQGISKGTREDDATWQATRYYVMFYDSSTGMASLPGPYVRIPVVWGFNGGVTVEIPAGNDSIRDYSITLGLPPIPPEKGHLWRMLCRAREDFRLEKVLDTTALVSATPALGTEENPYCRPIPGPGPPVELFYREGTGWMCGVGILDTTIEHRDITSYRVIDTIKNTTDSLYTDSASWGSVNNLEFASQLSSELLLSYDYPTIFENRLYLAKNSQVRYSAVNQVAVMPAGNTFTIDPDDGDEGTGFLATETGLLYFKNNAVYRVNSHIGVVGNLIHTAVKIRDLGCIAPHSIINLPMGGYAFLSNVGVQAYSTHYESIYKSSGGSFGEISKKIKVFLDAYGKDTLRNCHSWLTDDNENLVFSFPDVNTSLVYALATGEWNSWSFAPRQTTQYDTIYQTNLSPASDVLFCLKSSDSLYKYGGVKTDIDQSTTAVWISGPLFQTTDWGKIYKFGTWKESDITKTMTFRLQDQGDTTIDLINDSASVQYRRYGVNPEEAQYYKIYITVGSNIDSVEIKRVDLWWQKTTDSKEY